LGEIRRDGMSVLYEEKIFPETDEDEEENETDFFYKSTETKAAFTECSLMLLLFAFAVVVIAVFPETVSIAEDVLKKLVSADIPEKAASYIREFRDVFV
jgi:hypothetical protein